MQTYANAKDNASVPRKILNQQRRSSSQMNHSSNSSVIAGA